ncbi:ParB N-terminal domain-containing protein [Hasllibacter sp. MH4015]|uniref:ParB/RepB/Spo0J family partition protein n=1 Tax=Hasllibacter sp. MH4015 TaxID=2854029 RepID=UPI001CD516D2|nr:ParB N-terminal domain-containing protein [Hasllibacter sp. MH4015]
MPDIHHIPLTDIDEHALPRDRDALDATSLSDLTLSIAAHGLRMPIEVFPATGPKPYGLISGFRRLKAHRELTLDTIPAFIRQPADIPSALAAMIEENEIRADITPWERAKIVLTAIDHGHFDTIDQALPRLYPTYDRNRISRLRAIAEVVQHFGDHALTDPRSLSQQKLTRIATALRAGVGDTMLVALQECSDKSPATQWSLLQAIIEDAEAEAKAPKLHYKPGRPRYHRRVQDDLTVRRERTKDGWTLRFTGRTAKGPLMEDIMDYVEDMFGRRQR